MPAPDGNASESSERQMPNATSSAVTGWPSSHVASSRMVNVHSVKSSLGVPRSVARSGTSTGWPLLVADVLRQRAAGERLLDRVARDGPSGGRVERVGTRVAGEVDGDGAASGSSVDLRCGALTLSVLGAPLLVAEGPVRASAVVAIVRRPATTGSEGQKSGASDERERLVPLHAVQPFVFVLTEDGVFGACRDRGRSRVAQRRVLGSRASRTASPNRLSESTSATMPSRGCHRYCGYSRKNVRLVALRIV